MIRVEQRELWFRVETVQECLQLQEVQSGDSGESSFLQTGGLETEDLYALV